MIKWDLPQVHKDFPISANESVWYTTLTSRIKKKHLIISMSTEKASYKIQQSFMIKSLQKVTTEGSYIDILNAIYNKPIAHTIFNGEKLKVSPLGLTGNKTRTSTPAPFTQRSFQSPNHSNQKRKRNKRNQNWKRSSKSVTNYR